jgi:hypothetical protein
MKPFLLRFAVLCGIFSAVVSVVRAADTLAARPYAEIAQQRAAKIVGALSLSDRAQASRVQETIARQYRDLNAIQETRDLKMAEAKKIADAATSAKAIAEARASADAAIQTLHPEYLARLAVDLTPAQIDQVKDGMTYGVLPLTFRVYQEMLPNLTADQKQQILAWLTEAREHAMDAGSSKEKHAWFGKYKGRINNYLSAAGIDMKAAEKKLSKQ